MIITNVIGGLGNQMFQYAFGRALSLRYRVPLRLDVSDFEAYRLRGFQLKSIFPLAAEAATDGDRREVLGWRGYPAALRTLRRPRLERWRGSRLLVQDLSKPAAHYLSAASADCYLLGYWQSEAYFAEVADVIREDFRFTPALAGRNAEWAERIRRVVSASLHIRRGDYASDPATRAMHGLCSLEYYEAAGRMIADRNPGVEFFVFSDDLEWARGHLRMPWPHHFVDSNASHDSFHDMHLMSLCRHHIIANSSFSWWGAWLSEYEGKTVIAPHRWLAGADLLDIVPARWTRLAAPVQ